MVENAIRDIVEEEYEKRMGRMSYERDIPPEYFIFGGVVFIPLTLNYLEEWGRDWHLNTVDYLSYPLLFDNWQTEDRKEIMTRYTIPVDRIIF